ncbi:MAG: Histone acetyltransferase type B subunit 2 [Chrysothrix sp. TS-e1954]|nr:MAG: Histone acetyltransferase type B subunit 2 [Chrysothrix sp. TS-e1954]
MLDDKVSGEVEQSFDDTRYTYPLEDLGDDWHSFPLPSSVSALEDISIVPTKAKSLSPISQAVYQAIVDDDSNNAVAADEETIKRNKIINEEYKNWKKHAIYLYDIMLTRALTWPTLTLQWFPDQRFPPGENYAIHRLLLGTYTEDHAQNHLQIAHIQIPNMLPNPKDYDEDRGELGGYGSSKKVELKLDIAQKIDHPGEVNKARYMPQNPDLIATLCPDGRALIFDRTKHPSQPTGTVNPQIQLVGHTGEGFGLNWSPLVEGRLATGTSDNTVRVWDIKDFEKSSKNMKPSRTLTHHSATVNDVEFHPQIPHALVSVSDDRKIHIQDLRVQDFKKNLVKENAHDQEINAVAWNPKIETLFITGSADKSVRIWDLRCMDKPEHVMEQHKGPVTKLEWHPQHHWIFGSAGEDRRVLTWDISKVGDEQTPEDEEDGPPELHFMHGGHTDTISDFSFNKNDPWLMATAAEDNLVQVWKMAKVLYEKEKSKVLPAVPLDQLE